jgi:BASS family bile acid:Na+ symporter
VSLQQLVTLALQVSIFLTVLGFGLKTRLDDLLGLVRRPNWLVRSFLAVFIVMPLVAILLIRLFEFGQVVTIALIALAISPAPPLLPQRQERAGGATNYALALMAFLSLMAIVTVPLALEIFERISGRPLEMAPAVIARIVLIRSLLPLAAGMLVLALLPRVAAKSEKVVTLAAAILLPVAALVLIVGSAPAIWALVGDGTVIAMIVFLSAGLAIGHAMGGPDRYFSAALGVATAYRHPAMAFAIATTNFPEASVAGAILLYVVVGTIIGVPYVIWLRQWLQQAS